MKNSTYTLVLSMLLVIFGCKSLKQNTDTATNSQTQRIENKAENKNSEENAAAESLDMESEEFAEMIVISLSKTPCFGVCPSFNFTVFANGTAQYQGKENVKLKGEFKAKISKNEINQLLNEASSLGYFSLNDKYDNELVTDLPSTITFLNISGKSKKVVCRYECDDRIKKVNKMIDALIENTKWESVE